jgi:hypothetical protein
METFMKRILPMLLVIALLAAACGGGEDEATTDESTTTTAAGPLSTTTTQATTSTTEVESAPTWPWSGEVMTAAADAPPLPPVLIAKYSNAPKARPQQGLEAADMAMEVVVEGGVVRILAVFQSEIPDTIGPLRSVREVDPKLIEPFDATFLSSGGQPAVMNAIDAVAVNASDGRAGGYFRQSGRTAPYNLLLDTEAVVADAEPSTVENIWYSFDAQKPTGEQALTVDVGISSFHTTTYRYSSLDDGYLRFNGEEPHETLDGDQLVASTVVAVFVEQVSTGRVDSSGSPVPDFDVVGSGEAVVFRDGVAIPGIWERGRAEDFFRLFDSEGDPIPFKAGQIWFEIVPLDRSVEWQ